ncbi:hypothetical protein SS7213T_03085, partial [Staphylococcus simiae CCM 7213 = CCUG 51256]
HGVRPVKKMEVLTVNVIEKEKIIGTNRISKSL